MRSKLGYIALAVGALGVVSPFLATPVSAHHSIEANYDIHKELKFTGTVVKLVLINPHSFLYVDMKGPDGKVQRWGLELEGLGGVKRAGLVRADRGGLKPGDQITCEVYGARDGSATGFLRILTLPDGRVLKFGTDASE
jgi:Family of unknown function (DUF6152)